MGRLPIEVESWLRNPSIPRNSCAKILHRCMTEEELLGFTTDAEARMCAAASEITRCQMSDPCTLGASLHCIPNYLGRHFRVLSKPVL